MITSSPVPWPADRAIHNLASAGLSAPCVVRLKLFTLDNRLMIRRIGQLSLEDRNAVISELKAILPL
jgi:mRNA interferase MazF